MDHRQRAKEYITQHEGRHNTTYTDSLGIPTIGVGMNLNESRNRERIEGAGIEFDAVLKGLMALTDEQIDNFFDEDVSIARNDAITAVANYWSHPEDVQLALTDMSFQLGGPRLSQFVNMIAALNATPPDYEKAAAEIEDSLYATQTPNRAADNIALVKGCAVCKE